MLLLMGGAMAGSRPPAPVRAAPASAMAVLARAPGATRPRSAVLVSVDSLRADHLPFHGYPRMTTPFLAELVRRNGAVTYQRVTAVAPSCHPSHATLLSGLYPQQVGVPVCGEDLTVKPSDLDVPGNLEELIRFQDAARRSPSTLLDAGGGGGAVMNWMAIPDGTRTLATYFHEHGYRTGGFASIWTIHSRFGYGRGFEVYADDMPEYYGPRALTWLLRDTFKSQRRRPGEETLQKATAFLDDVRDDEPFFMFFHLADTHTPYAAPERITYDDEGPAAREAVTRTWNARYPDQTFGPAMKHMSQGPEFMLDAYDRSLRHADDILRRLFEELEARGRLQDTVILITSDHGESFGQHPTGDGGRPFFEHSVYVWEETQHVPMILYDPQRARPAEVRGMNVSQVDVAPTIVAATGHSPESFGAMLPGQDLRSLPDDPRTVFFLTFGRGKPGILKRLSLDYPNFIGFRSGDTKFFMDQKRLLQGAEGECHLYDLSQDPDEMHNLCGRPDQRDRVAWYRQVAVNWWERSVAPGRVPAQN